MHKFFLSLTLVGIFGLFGAAMMPASATAETENVTSDIIVKSIPGPTVAETLAARAKTSWPWYVTRASGLVAAVTLIILMLSGIGQVTGATFRFLEPLTAWATHRALGIVFGIAIVLHIGSILFDHFVPFTLVQVLVPWLSNYKPVTIMGVHLGSLYVALGVLSLWGAALVVFTSLVWVEKNPKLWKLVHLLSYAVMLFVFVHALYLGTDLLHGVLRWTWIGLGLATLVAVVSRMRRAFTA